MHVRDNLRGNQEWTNQKRATFDSRHETKTNKTINTTQKRTSNTDLTKNQGVSPDACEVLTVPASWDSI
jgi:hypothetical protein